MIDGPQAHVQAGPPLRLAAARARRGGRPLHGRRDDTAGRAAGLEALSAVRHPHEKETIEQRQRSHAWEQNGGRGHGSPYSLKPTRGTGWWLLVAGTRRTGHRLDTERAALGWLRGDPSSQRSP